MAALFDALIEHIDAHLDAVSAFSYRTQWKPASDQAQYVYERNKACRKLGPGGAWNDEEIRQALTYATLGLSVSGQMLDGVLSCLRSRDVLFPIAPIVRSILERLGMVGWVLDTGQDNPKWSVRDRVARVVLLEISDATHHYKAANEIGPQATIQRARQRLNRKRSVPDERFYKSEVKVTDRGDFILRGMKRPGVSDLSSYIGAGLLPWNHKGIYRVLSNATHPTYAPLAPLINVNDQDGPFWSLEDRRHFQPIAVALLAYSYTWELLAVYLGHPKTEMHQLRHEFQVDPRLQGL